MGGCDHALTMLVAAAAPKLSPGGQSLLGDYSAAASLPGGKKMETRGLK